MWEELHVCAYEEITVIHDSLFLSCQFTLIQCWIADLLCILCSEGEADVMKWTEYKAELLKLSQLLIWSMPNSNTR